LSHTFTTIDPAAQAARVFPFAGDTPVRFDALLPASCDVVVIGGGIIGVMSALFLRRRGLSVTLLEKGRIAAEQSSRNWGWIRQQGRDPDELPIMVEALSLWRQLAAECGEDIGLRQSGISYFARLDSEMAEFADFVALARSHGVDSRLLTAEEIAQMIPGMASRYRGGLITPSDMRAEPWIAVPAMARMAEREGVTIIEDCAARQLDIAAGRVAGVVTERGRIAAPEVLVAGGAWSSLFLRAHGVSIPQLSIRGTVVATDPLPEFHAGAATDEHLSFRRRQDGGYTLAPGGRHQLFVGPDAFRHATKYLPALRKNPFGTAFHPAAPRGYPDAWGTPRRWEGDERSPFERMRVLNPAPEPAGLRRIAKVFAELFPDLGPLPLRAAWGGMIDAMPDVVPMVDRIAALPGLTVGTGMSAHGFGIGPAMGRVLSAIVAGEAPGHDMTRFRSTRFTDGSPIRPGPAL
jgi:glycine/D-amino acid oxidase-like deaminating enzyme